ncbi:MAG: FAD-binding oxidoreductase [Pseudomonas sp.]
MSELGSWGRFPPFRQTGHECHWRSELAERLQRLQQDHGSTLAYGNGRSYGDSCLASSDQVLHVRGLDRFIAVDWGTGVLQAECGVTLDQLLQVSIPRGWFLPVTPGTRFVTLGGALANDVHGKNHHVRGTFGRHVLRFSLLRSDGSRLLCSAEENPQLFAASIGGLGLTGIVEWIELQLMPIRSSQLAAQHMRFTSLDEFFALSAEQDPLHEYSVAWVDCLARGAQTGRGIYSCANHAADGELAVARGKTLRVPLTPPISAINGVSLNAFNHLYYRRHPVGAERMDYARFFYPLDRLLEWNRIYGPRGFQQFQCVIPDAAAPDALREILQAIAASGRGSFLAVLKRCGDLASPGLLSFPLAGTSLALDFPQHERANRQLFSRLDRIVSAAQGRLYPAKDAHMSALDFRQAYPAWEQVEALRDPALCSRFWQRVTQA